jgi:hypothetical protein
MKRLIFICLLSACTSSTKYLKEEYARVQDSLSWTNQIIKMDAPLLETLKTEETKSIYRKYLDSLNDEQRRLEKRKQDLAAQISK